MPVKAIGNLEMYFIIRFFILIFRLKQKKFLSRNV